MKKTILCALCALSVSVGLAQQFVAPNVEWVNNLAFKNSRESVPSAIDENGNIYTVGFVTSGGNMNSVLLKIDSVGTTLFVATYNGPGNGDDKGLGLAISDSGYVYICGESAGSGTGKDFYTIKYDASGTQLWVSRYNNSGSGDDVAVGLVVDAAGSVYTTGRSTNGSGNFDYKVIKYNHSGVQQWVYTYNGTASGDDRPRSIALSDSNRVYVTGYTTSTSVGKDITTIRINTSTGSADWVKTINGASNTNEEGNAVIMDGYDPVIVGGIVNTGSNMNYYTAKLNRVNGNVLWSQTYDAHGNTDEAYSIARTDSGWFAVTGLAVNAGNYEYHTLLYNNGGTLLSTNKYATNITTPTVTPKVAIDTIANHIYVVGETNNGTANVDVVAYQITPSGNFGWIKTYNGAGNAKDVGVDLAVNAWGQIFLCAQTGNATGDVDITTIRISQTPVYLPVDTANYPGNTNHIFWQNQGQIFDTNLDIADSVLYYATEAYPFEYIKKNAISFVNQRIDTSVATADTLERIDMTFDEINPYAEIFAYDQTDYYHNYILGGMAAPVSNLYGHRHLFAPNYYHGIDLHYYSNTDGIKIVFVVRPGYDPYTIKQFFNGQQGTYVNGSGELEIYGLLDTLVFNPPNMFNVAYPPFTSIPASGGAGWFNHGAANEFHFDVGSYYNVLPLVIEITQKAATPIPVTTWPNNNLAWSTYIGGAGIDALYDVEHSGTNTYVLGDNQNGNYPTVLGSFQFNYAGSKQVVVSRFNYLDQLFWSTYYGGTATNCANGVYNSDGDMDIDKFGYVYVTGNTNAKNFPIKNPGLGSYVDSFNVSTTSVYSQCINGFIFKLDSSGVSPIWSTYFGNTGDNIFFSLALNKTGSNFVVGGYSNTPGNIHFPAPGPNAFFDTLSTYGYGILLRFDNNGVLKYGTRVNGIQCRKVSFNSTNNNYYIVAPIQVITPPMVNPGNGAYFDSTLALEDYYVAGFNTQDTIIWGTLVGGSGNDHPDGITVSADNELTIVGHTTGTNFPIKYTAGQYIDSVFTGGTDILITKFASDGKLSYSTYYGGTGTDIASAAVYDQKGNLFAIGNTDGLSSFNLQSLTGFYNGPTSNALTEGYVICLDSNESKILTTLFGGYGTLSGSPFTSDDDPRALSVNSQNHLYMTGITTANHNFPLYNTNGVAHYDTLLTGSPYNPSEGFLAKFILNQSLIGIDEIPVKANDLLVFPNPSQGIYNIVIKGVYDKKVNLYLYDVTGRLVKSESFIKNPSVHVHELDASMLSNGVYFLNLVLGNQTLNCKLILNR